MTWSKTDIHRANSPTNWNIKPSGGRGAILTFFVSTTEQLCSTAKKSFHAKSTYSCREIPSKGVEANIIGYFEHDGILYVDTIGLLEDLGKNKLYRLLTINKHHAKQQEKKETYITMLRMQGIPEIQ